MRLAFARSRGISDQLTNLTDLLLPFFHRLDHSTNQSDQVQFHQRAAPGGHGVP